MKRFIFRTIAGCFLIVVIGIIIVLLTPKEDDDYMLEYDVKMALLDSIPSPRIVFVGGSNLAFGLDSHRISDSIGLPVVNTGLHAGIGLKLIIDDVFPRLHEGDIVIIAPEYSHFFGSAYGESDTMGWFIYVTDKEKRKLLNNRQWGKVIIGLYAMVGSGTKGFIRDCTYSFMPGKNDVWTYSKYGFNDVGDEVAHWYAEGDNIMPDIETDAVIDEEFADYFFEKVDGLSDGITVVLCPPVIRKSSYEASKKRADAMTRLLQSRGYPFIVPTQNHVLPDSCAFNTPYHMKKSGVDIFTSMLIEELKPLLN